LYILEIATGRVRRITQTSETERTSAWSPDGKWIVFSADNDDSSAIWLIRPDGTGLRELSH
jgi:TolB protein